MLYHKTECPHCGNEITVSNEKRIQKCCWCKRLVSAKFERTSKKKVKCEVETVDFTESQKQSFSKWKDEEIYGV